MVHPRDCTGWPILEGALVKVSAPAGDYTARVKKIEEDVLVLREERGGRQRYARPSKVEVQQQRGTAFVPKPAATPEGKPYVNPFKRDRETKT